MKNITLQVEVLSACNLEPKYFNCIKSYIDFWKNTMTSTDISFTPKVILIADKVPSVLQKYQEYIQPFNIEGVSDIFLSQVTRLFFPSYSTRDLVITSDIDMFPLSNRAISGVIKKVYLKDGFNFSSKNFIVFRDVLPLGQLPICYNIASPSSWKVLTGDLKLDSLSQTLKREYAKISENYDGEHGGKSWYFDQSLLYKLVRSKNNIINILCFKDKETGYKRLDRINWQPPLYWIIFPLVLFNYFDDYHINHPLSKRVIWINTLLMSKKVSNSIFLILEILLRKKLWAGRGSNPEPTD